MSIYVAVPKSDRAALRAGGGAPGRFIREMGEPGSESAPIILWPQELDFAAGTDGGKEESWKDRPVDLGWFFGLGRAEKDSDRKKNEQRVIPLLLNPLVCIVFLDELRQPEGYVKFKTFSAVKDWSYRLQRALSVRFPHESRIGRAPRSLVLIARKEQVTTTQDELDDFRLCIGMDCGHSSGDGSSLSRTFTSCYFLDCNLRLGSAGRPFPSDDVWEIVVGRLLLAFVLSEGGDGKPLYARPGLKIWRNADCRAGLVPDDESREVEACLGALSKKIRERLELSDGDAKVIVNTPSPETLRAELDAALKKMLPDGTGNEDWRKAKTFPKGWSDFDGTECLKQTRDEAGTRWGDIFKSWRKAFPAWRRRHRDTGILWEMNQTFKGVKKSPSNVAFEVARLRDLLNDGTVAADPVAHWKNMVAKERLRSGLLNQLAADTKEFERARSHYVGIAIGSFVFLAVTAALGWAGYHVAASAAALFGGGATLSMTLAISASACVATGALAAFAIVTICHRRSGIRAMNALIETSKAADQAMSDRDVESREIVVEGMSASAFARIRAGRFRAWMLLKRLQTMLDAELSPQLAHGVFSGNVEVVGKTGGDSVEDTDRTSNQRAFLNVTRTEFGPFGLDKWKGTRLAENERVEKWWKDVFMPVWEELARKDVRKAGNYPARKVVPSLRKVMMEFFETVRTELRKQAARSNQEQLDAEFSSWREKQEDGRSLYAYASAGFTGAQVDERATDSAVIHYNPSVVAPFRRGVDKEANGGTNFRNIHAVVILQPSPCLEGTEWIGLVHHEVRVCFGVDEGGHLVFKGESHVNRRG